MKKWKCLPGCIWSEDKGEVECKSVKNFTHDQLIQNMLQYTFLSISAVYILSLHEAVISSYWSYSYALNHLCVSIQLCSKLAHKWAICWLYVHNDMNRKYWITSEVYTTFNCLTFIQIIRVNLGIGTNWVF